MSIKEWFRDEWTRKSRWITSLPFSDNENFDEIWEQIISEVRFSALYGEIINKFILISSQNSNPIHQSNLITIIPETIQQWFVRNMTDDSRFASNVRWELRGHVDASLTSLAQWSIIASESRFTSLFKELTSEYEKTIRHVESDSLEGRLHVRNTEFQRLRRAEEWSNNNSSSSSNSQVRSYSLSTPVSNFLQSKPVPIIQQKVYNEQKTIQRLIDNIGLWKKTLQPCSDKGLGQCCVCMDYHVNVVYSPCRHMICCLCAYDTFVTNRRKTCQACSQAVHSVKIVFF